MGLKRSGPFVWNWGVELRGPLYIILTIYRALVAFIGVAGLKFCLEIGKKVRILCIHKNRTVVYEHVTWHSRPFF